ncbi:putative target SNARE coiled-coil domain-containing protein [Helianthus annuus]|nr:putative target SNARE coiled-coil domain-containing protein [Helianthus annuus]
MDIRIDDNMEETLSHVEGARGALLKHLNQISSNRNKMPLQTLRIPKIVDENGSNKGLLTLFQSHVNHFRCLMVLKYMIYIK